MKEQFLEVFGRGLPAEFLSVWNQEQSLVRLKQLLQPRQTGFNTDELRGRVEIDRVVLQAPVEDFVRASGDEFCGRLVCDARGVRLVGAFRVSPLNSLVARIFIVAMMLFLLASVAFGLVGIANHAMTATEAITTLVLLPLPALLLGLFFVWCYSLNRQEIALISREIQRALSDDAYGCDDC